jgi:hypothetical protein
MISFQVSKNFAPQSICHLEMDFHTRALKCSATSSMGGLSAGTSFHE